MTNEEWLACDTPARMRGIMNGRPQSQLRWVQFDLACIDRVIDLIDDQRCLDYLHVDSDWVCRQWDPSQFYLTAQHTADEAIRKLWSRRTDPLQHARIAAFRAISRLASRTLASSEMVCVAVGRRIGQPGLTEAVRTERQLHATLARCVFRSTLSPITFSPSWRTDTAISLARTMYDSRDFSAMPILADALQDAGCDSEDILNHCRSRKQIHVRGCWVVDMVLEK